MIARLKGTVAERLADAVILDVGGVGYHVHAPASTLDQIGPAGSALTLHTVVRAPRDEAPQLYGFISGEERTLFERITSVSGIGPRLGLAILSGLSPDNFRRAVLARDLGALTSISGVGRKTAERLVVELRDRFTQEPVPSHLPGAGGGAFQDAVTALVTLGYPRPLAVSAVTDVLGAAPADLPVEEIVRKALGRISSR